MNDELLSQVAREVLRWDRVSKERDENTVNGIDVTGYVFRQ